MDNIYQEKVLKETKEHSLTGKKTCLRNENLSVGKDRLELERTCRRGDGIVVIPDREIERLINIYQQNVYNCRISHFIPTGGDARELLKDLYHFETVSLKSVSDTINVEEAESRERRQNCYKALIRFFKYLERFAFYGELKDVFASQEKDLEALRRNHQYEQILNVLLSPERLNYANSPRALLKYHRYEHGEIRTALEEQFVESLMSGKDKNSNVRICLVMPARFESAVKAHVEQFRKKYEDEALRLEISFVSQEDLPESAIVDQDSRLPDDSGRALLFRSSESGILLEHLNRFEGDIVFIKNIDNVIVDRLKNVSSIYWQVLGGYLIELQNNIFYFMERLKSREYHRKFLRYVLEFLENKLLVSLPSDSLLTQEADLVEWLIGILNRPIRVCGMVRERRHHKNDLYLGRPFWIRNAGGEEALQIVRAHQVDERFPEQVDIWNSSGYFSPLDIACGLRDYQGNKFDLNEYGNLEQGYVLQEPVAEKNIKIPELSGFWSGAMRQWNTVFVEVPAGVASIVNSVLDLLLEEHQIKPAKRVD